MDNLGNLCFVYFVLKYSSLAKIVSRLWNLQFYRGCCFISLCLYYILFQMFCCDLPCTAKYKFKHKLLEHKRWKCKYQGQLDEAPGHHLGAAVSFPPLVEKVDETEAVTPAPTLLPSVPSPPATSAHRATINLTPTTVQVLPHAFNLYIALFYIITPPASLHSCQACGLSHAPLHSSSQPDSQWERIWHREEGKTYIKSLLHLFYPVPSLQQALGIRKKCSKEPFQKLQGDTILSSYKTWRSLLQAIGNLCMWYFDDE